MLVRYWFDRILRRGPRYIDSADEDIRPFAGIAERQLFDQDALLAATDLVRRSGAASFSVGYLHDDPGLPPEQQGWWAAAYFRGARITIEGAGPVEAAEGLARRLLAGAQCRRCGHPIILNDDAEGCRWTRMGKRWVPGCDKPVDLTIPVRR